MCRPSLKHTFRSCTRSLQVEMPPKNSRQGMGMPKRKFSKKQTESCHPSRVNISSGICRSQIGSRIHPMKVVCHRCHHTNAGRASQRLTRWHPAFCRVRSLRDGVLRCGACISFAYKHFGVVRVCFKMLGVCNSLATSGAMLSKDKYRVLH